MRPGLSAQIQSLEVATVLSECKRRLTVQPYSYPGRKPAIHERAQAIVQRLVQVLARTKGLFQGEASFERPRVNFGIYSLRDAIAEAGTLRSVVLDQLDASDPKDALLFRDAILSHFDVEVALLCEEYDEFRRAPSTHGSQTSTESKEASESSGDTRFLTQEARGSSIVGTIESLATSLSDAHPVRRQFLRRHAELLSEASRAFAGSMDFSNTIREIAAFSLRTIADWVIIDCKNSQGAFMRGLVMHREPERKALADELWNDFGPRPDSWGVPSQVLRTRTSLLVPKVDAAHYQATRRSSRHEEILRALGSSTYMCVPMTARGEFVGAVTFVKDDPKSAYGDEDLLFAEEVCARAAIALDNAVQFERAQNAVRLREDFVSIVSHDLKNPLTVIDMAATLILKRDAIGQPLERKLIDRIQETGRRMSTLINDLLDLSKFEAGRFTIEPTSVAVGGLLTEVADAYMPLAAGKAVRISCRPEREAIVFGDASRLHQIFGNLVSNAIKFAPEGGEVRLECTRAPGFVEIAVRDNGPGIPSADVPKLFDRFWQAQSTARKGTGLGLSIVKAMVEAHKGSVRVETREGSGASFLVRLPAP